MRVLIACEKSGVVRRAFRDRGHDAWSCDLEPAEDNSEHHLRVDIMSVLRNHAQWDLLIAHPPCTHLSVSGACRFKEKRADGRQQEAIDFFMYFVERETQRICIENPIGIMSTKYRKPDQIIQPYDFGEDASKKTCLWLKGLSILTSTKFIQPRIVTINGKQYKRWANQCDSGQNKLGPSPTRAADRAKTYSGIAAAMAEQWSK